MLSIADVVIHYLSEAEQAEETAVEVRGLSRQTSVVVKADLKSPEEINQAFDTIASEWGALDILASNAAHSTFESSCRLKDYHLDRIFRMVIRLLTAQRGVSLMEGGSHIRTGRKTT